MAQESRTTLKGYFNTGDTPTEAQFASLIDSFFSYASDFRIAFGKVNQVGTAAPVFTFMFNQLGFTPTTSYNGVGDYYLTSVGNLDASKVVLMLPNVGGDGAYFELDYATSPDDINIITYTAPATQGNGVLSNAPFLILLIP
jgi:hypothetical protein